VAELKKCILVCCRCHAEIHSGLIDENKFSSSYDDSFTNYKKARVDFCRCGATKSIKLKYCSPKCSQKARRKVNWDKIDLLKMKSKLKSNVKIAKKLGVSETCIRKRLSKL